MNLEISHLVVNGCSFTYCQGLYDPPNEGWPKLLANKLGVPVVNLAAPGSSNDRLHRITYDYFYKNLPYNSKPFYIPMMTQNIRAEAYVTIGEKNEPINDYVNISALDDLELSQAFYYHMDERGISYSQARKLRYWASLINLFDSTNTPFVTADYMPEFNESTLNFINKRYSEIDTFINSHPNKLTDIPDITGPYPKALDNGHDGPEAQVVLADYLYNEIVKRYGEIIPVKLPYLSLKDFPIQTLRLLQTNQWFLHELGKKYFYGLPS
jgi:hypothetical protein